MPGTPPPTARRRRAARLAGVLAVAGALAGAWGLFVEPRRLEVTRHVLGAPEPGRRPLRLVHLTDLHVREVGTRERALAALVRAEAPDLVVITGDLLGQRDPEPLVEALRLMGGVPLLAVRGNWEVELNLKVPALRDALARAGCRLLVNEVASVEHDGRRAVLLGLDEGVHHRLDLPRLAALVAGEANVLVLEHAPAVRDRWPGSPAAAMLSGHTHGGQVAFLGRALVLPPAARPYVAGWYRGAPVDLYVSRGVGTSVLPLRLGARPEVAVFDWWLR